MIHSGSMKEQEERTFSCQTLHLFKKQIISSSFHLSPVICRYSSIYPDACQSESFGIPLSSSSVSSSRSESRCRDRSAG